MQAYQFTVADIREEMQYSSVSEETLNIGPYTLEFWQDTDSENPYDNCDGMTPAIWYGLNGGFTEYGDGAIDSFFYVHVTFAWVSRNWRAICKAMDLTESEFDAECKEFQADYGGMMKHIRQEKFAERLSDMKAANWSDAIDYLETLRALYNLAGIPAETFEKHGYCQGDSVRGLIVMTPAWAKRVGAPHAMPGKLDKEACEKDMATQADTYGQWVWGDCFGYTVEYDGETVDSCGGFYPESDNGEYAISQAVDAMNRDAQARVETGLTLYASDSHGVYIPQYFAQSVKREFVTGVSPDDWTDLETGPDSESYWDTWTSVLDNAVIHKPENRTETATLYQDGDLWIIADSAQPFINWDN